jgi:hypothetical protein
MTGERPPWVSATQNFELAQAALVQMREHSNENLIVGMPLSAQLTRRPRFDKELFVVCCVRVSCVSCRYISFHGQAAAGRIADGYGPGAYIGCTP